MTNGIVLNKQGKSQILEHAFMTSTTTTKASQFKIGTGQVLLSESSTDLTNPVYFTGTQEYQDFTAQYPKISTSTTPEVTIDCRVGANQGTGNDINTAGLFNTDATPKLLIQLNHPSESKNNTDEFVYVVRHRIL